MKKNKLALFDLDDTLFDGDTEGEWVQYMNKNSLITDPDFFNTMEQFTVHYRQGQLDVNEYSKFLLSPLIGKSLQEIEDSVEIFSFDVVDRLTDDLTQELLKKHKEDIKILTSGSLSFLVDSIGKKLGIETCFGTDPEYLDGVFTGSVKGNPNFSDEKVRRIKYWMESKQFDEIYSYSDSIHDLPLLEFSHFPCTISPDKKLRKVAEDRKWLIEDRRSPHS